MRHLLTTCVIAVLLLVPAGTLAAEEASPAATFGPDETATLEAMQTSASTLWALGDHAGAIELLEQIVEAFTRVLGPENPDTLVAMDNLEELLAAMDRPLSKTRSDRRATASDWETTAWPRPSTPCPRSSRNSRHAESIDQLRRMGGMTWKSDTAVTSGPNA